MKKSFRQYASGMNGIDIDYHFRSFLLNYKKLNESYNNQNISDIYDEFLKICPTYYSSQYKLYNNLFEFLKTVNPELFIKRIRAISPQIHLATMADIHVYVFAKKEYIVDNVKLLLDPDIEKQLDILSNAFCYYENSRCITTDKNGNEYLEISYNIVHTDNMTDIVYKKYHGILWHVCPKSIYENYIKTQGLLLKCNNKHKRQYLPRLYFFLNPAAITTKQIQHLAKDLMKAYNKAEDNSNTYVLLKIDLNKACRPDVPKYRYQFYDDLEYAIPEASVYTYETIHPKCIKYIKDIVLS